VLLNHRTGFGRWLADLPVATKLSGGFGGVFALLAVIAGMALWGNSARGSPGARFRRGCG
jgi:hypothetical protein